MKDLTKLKFYCQKVLPLVYDDSLSYIEVLYKVAYKLNEVIENYNELKTYCDELNVKVEEYDDRISALENVIDTFEQTVMDLFDQLQTQIYADVDAKLDEVDEKLASVDGRIDALEIELRQQISDMQTYLMNLINTQLQLFREELERNNIQLRFWVENELEEFLKKIPDVQNVLVISPISGIIMNIQDALNELANVFRIFYGITAREYDDLKLTATQYDHYPVNGINRGLTATEYDFFAKRYLYVDFAEQVYHPATGKKVNFRKVISFNTDLEKASGSYTASEYDALLKTATEYDGLELTAYRYDWLSNSLIA